MGKWGYMGLCAPVSLQRLVLDLDSDVRFVLNELPTNVWSVISKKLEQLGVEDREVFQSNTFAISFNWHWLQIIIDNVIVKLYFFVCRLDALGISIQEMDKLVPKITQLIIDELSSQPALCSLEECQRHSSSPVLYRRTNSARNAHQIICIRPSIAGAVNWLWQCSRWSTSAAATVDASSVGQSVQALSSNKLPGDLQMDIFKTSVCTFCSFLCTTGTWQLCLTYWLGLGAKDRRSEPETVTKRPCCHHNIFGDQRRWY